MSLVAGGGGAARQQVKKFLMDAKLPDPRPLIHVCDRHDFIEEMTGYLYKSNLQKYIEVRWWFVVFVMFLLHSDIFTSIYTRAASRSTSR